MAYVGDFALGDTFDVKFCTVQTTGAPFTLAGSPVISAYPGNSTTEVTAGITLSVDFDSRTGLNNVRVVATSGNGYLTATNYQLVITTGTVNSVSAVGYVVAEFSIENRSNVRTSGNLPVGAIAALGIIDNGTAQSVTGTTLVMRSAAAFADSELVGATVVILSATTGAGQRRIITANVGSTDTLTVATWTTTPTGTILYAIFGSAPGDSNSPVPATLSGTQTFNMTGSITGSLSGSVGSVTGAVGSVTTVSDKTGYTLSNTGMDNLLTRAMTEAYAADGATVTLAQALYEILAFQGEKNISGTTLTTKKRDGSTAAATYTLGDATTPLTITRAS